MSHGSIKLMVNGVVVVAGLFAAASSVAARDFEQRTALHNRSLYQGLGKPAVNLLEREPGRGQIPVLNSVYERMQRANLIASPISVEDADDGKRTLQGAEWKLSVHEDGTRVRFRNRSAIEDNRARGRSFLVEQRMSNAELESRGRAFVRDHLDDLVVLGAGEEMVPLFTEHEIEQAERSDGFRVPDQVVASTVVFGRTVDGTYVIGAGSKVAIMFSAEGRPIGFDVDWPQYRKLARRQQVHAAQVLRERASALSSMQFGADVVATERYECGYVDMGSRRKRRDSAAPIQAGCAVHYSGRRFIADTAAQRAAIAQLPEEMQPHETHAQLDFIPAGVTVEHDGGWPQALAACTGEADECRASELSNSLFAEPPPPAAPKLDR